MNYIEYFKLKSKNLFKDYKIRTFNEEEGYYEYNPRFFNDIEQILDNFRIADEDKFTLMKAQHIIARLAGFYKWEELIKATEPILKIGIYLLNYRQEYSDWLGVNTDIVESMIVTDWKEYEQQYLDGCDDDTKLEIFEQVFIKDGFSKINI